MKAIARVFLLCFCAVLSASAGWADTGQRSVEAINYEMKTAPADIAVVFPGKEWHLEEASLISPPDGYQIAHPGIYSALKTFTVEATFSIREHLSGGGAGLHIGFHQGVPFRGWSVLYYPDDGEVRFEYRSASSPNDVGMTVTLLAKKTIKVTDNPINIKVVIDSDRKRWLTYVNGVELFNFRPQGIPVFLHTGLCVLNARAAFQTFTIKAGGTVKPMLAVGDSITHHCRWSEIASQKSGIDIGNAGMACDTTAGVLARLDTDIIAMKPSYALILIGTNDGSVKTTTNNIAEIARRLERAGIRPVLCTLLPREGQDRIGTVNEFIRKLCSTKGFSLIDWHDDLEGPKKYLNKDYGDSVHPNARGAELMADFLLDTDTMKNIIDNIHK